MPPSRKAEPQGTREATYRRILILMKLPPGGRRKSVTQIHDELGVEGVVIDKRQVQKDLVWLSTKFALVSDEGSPPGWGWAKDAHHPFLQTAMDPHVALTFLLAEKHLSVLLPRATLAHLAPFFAQARKCLAKGNGRQALAEWDKRTHISQRGIVPRPPEVAPAVEATVMHALVKGKRIEVVYEKHDGTVRGYVLSPLGILSRGNVVYLVAKPARQPGEDDKGTRSFALHRVREAVDLDMPVETVPDFDVARLDREGAFGIAHGPERVPLVLEVRAEASRGFRDLRYADDQRIVSSTATHLTVSLSLPDTEELRWWLLAFGGRVEVVEPRWLREELEGLKKTG